MRKFYKFTEDIAKCDNLKIMDSKAIMELMQQETNKKDRPRIGYKIKGDK
ncbi:MAG: hypothetical protein K8R37_02565 [Bacteroidales bacterium]|nr:hypothetical protein [Bacteroidales bacterium]